MGVNKSEFALLCELKNKLSFQGRVLQLGRQRVSMTFGTLKAILSSYSLPPYKPEAPLSVHGQPTDEVFFKALGFSEVESLDAHGFEGATIVHDLNLPVPDEWKERYDFIYDGGTSEHVFNFPQCLKNIYDLLKPGGFIVHHVPTSNYVNHGFYSFNPIVFTEYYSANKFDLIDVFICEAPRNFHRANVYVYKYDAAQERRFDCFNHGLGLRRHVDTFVVAQKNEYSTKDVIPQQNAYQSVWQSVDNGAVRASKPSLLARICNKLKNILSPGQYQYAKRVYQCIMQRQYTFEHLFGIKPFLACEVLISYLIKGRRPPLHGRY